MTSDADGDDQFIVRIPLVGGGTVALLYRRSWERHILQFGAAPTGRWNVTGIQLAKVAECLEESYTEMLKSPDAPKDSDGYRRRITVYNLEGRPSWIGIEYLRILARKLAGMDQAARERQERP